MKTKYDTELLGIISLFEKITRSRLKDVLYMKERLVFILEKGELGKALGKQKGNIKKLEDAFNKKIKLVEYNPDLLTFIRNLMYPLKILSMKEEEGIVTIKGPDAKTKGLMIGSKAQNLRLYESVTQKYFPDLKEIKVT